MKIFSRLCLAIISLCLVFSFQHAYAETNKIKEVKAATNESDKEDPAAQHVKFRKAAFQTMKYYYNPLGAMVKGKIPFDAAEAKINADAVATLSLYPIDGFKTKSLTEESTALSKIWDDFADFENKMLAFQKAANNLSDNTDSLKELKPAFLEVAETCKSCHNNYRKKKNK